MIIIIVTQSLFTHSLSLHQSIDSLKFFIKQSEQTMAGQCVLACTLHSLDRKKVQSFGDIDWQSSGHPDFARAQVTWP